MIEVPGYGLPGHLARTACGRLVAFGRMPNVPRTDPRFCPRCREVECRDGIPPFVIPTTGEHIASELLAVTPVAGDRVLRLHIGGVLDLAIPPGLEEDGDGWDAWFDAAIAAVLDDGRWNECTSITDSEVGVLDEDGLIR